MYGAYAPGPVTYGFAWFVVRRTSHATLASAGESVVRRYSSLRDAREAQVTDECQGLAETVRAGRKDSKAL